MDSNLQPVQPAGNTEEKKYASVEEFAAMLSVSVFTIRRMIALNEIPAFRVRKGGRKYVIDVRLAIERMQQNKAV